MKVAIIDDSELLVATAVRNISEAGYEAVGFTERGPSGIYGPKGKIVDISFRQAFTGVDVLFLDHNMPEKGDSLLARLREMGLVTTQRVIGISSSPQTYLKERVPSHMLNSVEALKSLLG